MEFLEANEIIHKDLVIKSYTEIYRYLVSITMVIGFSLVIVTHGGSWNSLDILMKTGVMATKHARLYNFFAYTTRSFDHFLLYVEQDL